MHTEETICLDKDTPDGTVFVQLAALTKGYHTETGVLPSHRHYVEFDATDATLSDMVGQVEYFLKSMGYSFDHLDIAHTPEVADKLDKMSSRYHDGYGAGYDCGYKQGQRDAMDSVRAAP